MRVRTTCEGIGLHSGRPVWMSIGPAVAGTGIVFRRVDLGVSIAARYDLVADTRLCTLIASEQEPSARVGTVEHLMAALAAIGVDNAIVEVDGPELPIMDGSSRPFMSLIHQAGLAAQPVVRELVEVRRTVRVTDGAAYAQLSPSPSFGIDLSIDFEAPAIGRQSMTVDRLDARRFASELAGARTFTMADEIDRLRAAGLARGGSLGNAVVVDGASVLNSGGLRWPDEFVRHKALDAIGDLALAGYAIRGRFTGHRSGHGLNNRILRALFADPANWRLVEAGRHPVAADRAA